ncbi:MAG: NAD(P)-dependent oxidoreductase [Candidatus Helarchaeota archaeon]
MGNILITAPFDENCLKELRKFENKGIKIFYESWTDTGKLILPYELVERIPKDNIEILIIEAEKVWENVLQLEQLKVLGVCRGNPEEVTDKNKATENGVLILNTPGRNASSVAELAIALMINLARRIIISNNLVKAKKYDNQLQFEQYTKYRGFTLENKNIGIVGLGAVGFEVAKRLTCFGSNIYVYDPYVSDERLKKVNGNKVDLKTLMSKSDIITIHAPVTKETTGMINKDMISLMKPTAFLVNTARAALIDQDALIDALINKKIAGFALDVYKKEPLSRRSPLLKLPEEVNVILTSHIGGATDNTVENHSKIITDDILRYLEGKTPKNVYNREVLNKFNLK